jgi:hypothetical protein
MILLLAGCSGSGNQRPDEPEEAAQTTRANDVSLGWVSTPSDWAVEDYILSYAEGFDGVADIISFTNTSVSSSENLELTAILGYNGTITDSRSFIVYLATKCETQSSWIDETCDPSVLQISDILFTSEDAFIRRTPLVSGDFPGDYFEGHWVRGGCTVTINLSARAPHNLSNEYFIDLTASMLSKDNLPLVCYT